MTDAPDHWRAHDFASAVAMLEGARSAGLADQALTVGLAAMVAASWPEELRYPDGKMKSARDLCKILRQRGRLDVEGRLILREASSFSQPSIGDVEELINAAGPASAGEGGVSDVAERGYQSFEVPESVVDLSAIEELISRLARVRHARLPGGPEVVTDDDIALIRSLDDHPALGWGSLIEDPEADALEADVEEQARAWTYWVALPEWERERRANRELAGHDEPFDPKDRIEYPEPQECPVCLTEGLVVTGDDGLGYGIGYGLCVACSYRRSPDIAYWLAVEEELERHRHD